MCKWINKLNNRKAFTIVELVIVIAVIAILATVLVPTFGNVINNAKDSAAKQEARNAYTEYVVEAAASGAMGQYYVYQADEGRFVAIDSGAAVGVYESKEAALAAMIPGADLTKLNEIEDSDLFVYDVVPANPGGNGGNDDSGNEPDEPDTPTDWSGASAVFVGDSITEGVGTTAGKIYHDYLKALLELSKTTNMGIASSCISDNCTNTAVASLYDRYKNIPTNQDLIVIFMGTNDYGHAAALGDEASMDPNNFYGALNTILPYLTAQHPDSQIVVMTPLHRNGFKSSGMNTGDIGEGAKNDKGNVLSDYVAALKSVCAKNSIPVIDLYTLVTLDPTDKTYFNDGLHPNAAGHEAIAKIIAE